MAEPGRAGSAQNLQEALHELGDRIAYPPTPPIVVAVRSRLAAPPGARRFPLFSLPAGIRLACAVLALLLVAGVGMALSPAARTTVAERLGLPGIAIMHLPALPSLDASRAPGADATAVGAPDRERLGLGEPVTLAEARSRVAYRVLVPTLPELGAPDEVYVGEPPRGGQVALVYRERPGVPLAPETDIGVLLTQFDGSLVIGQFGKGLGPGTQLEGVQVAGANGYWMEGAPHVVFRYQDGAGVVRSEPTRLAANVLLWQRGDLVLRLEGAIAKDQALRIAAWVG
ncbi:MAG: hypothetical protein GEU73_10615 [Chloroflexi bacterium]|nr:hypothetical protein [Chloroflexota bacterium]